MHSAVCIVYGMETESKTETQDRFSEPLFTRAEVRLYLVVLAAVVVGLVVAL